MRYRLGLDLGSTSIGWAMLRLDADNNPCAVIKAGVRIFSDGRNPKDGSSLAVTRRLARAMRRRRDRLLKRKQRMLGLLIKHGFFPADESERKALELLDPYELRARGLDQALEPGEFARAVFHINQRRGFKSNRKTDKKDNDAGALKSAISSVREALDSAGCRTVGEWLHKRKINGQSVRARYRAYDVISDSGKKKQEFKYDLYIDREMVKQELALIWEKQASLNPALFTEVARRDIEDCLLFQRPLKPVKPGRCTLLPSEERAPLALPSQQRFRILQEVNNLRWIGDDLTEQSLTKTQRDKVVEALEKNGRRTFNQLRKLLGIDAEFNLEDAKRSDLKGNATAAILSKDDHFGSVWHVLSLSQQDRIVTQLLTEENTGTLVAWLIENTEIEEATAQRIAETRLPEGYGNLSEKALSKILPQLYSEVVSYADAVIKAGFEHHSNISHAATGEILESLPYYGEYLQRHVGFGSGNLEDTPEKRFGKLANPTVHIGLNQLRVVVNELIRRYGHPSEVIVEVARDLKQSQEQRREEQRRQAENQKRNERLRSQAAELLGITPDRVKIDDLHKLILWEELNLGNAADRRCPYSGLQISAEMLLGPEVEIEHILPFSRTLDDSLSNKTVSLRQANRIKGNRSPWESKEDFERMGWSAEAMIERAKKMPKNKRYRFGETAWTEWDKEGQGFLARALNDTRYLSRIAREYLSLICPQQTRVIPGQMTALLRRKFGLNNVLSHDGEKNRDDHRHHAVDACVVASTDQRLLQQFAKASANARSSQVGRLVDDMPLPWPSFREHVQRAVNQIWVSHKPDHGFEGAMHNDTAYGLLEDGMVKVRKNVDGVRVTEITKLNVIPISDQRKIDRHGQLPDGSPKPYKGYKGDSNYCIEIVRGDKNQWSSEVITTFQAYQVARKVESEGQRDKNLSSNQQPLVMRLMKDDCVFVTDNTDEKRLLRVVKIGSNGQIFLAEHYEANVDARNRDKTDSFSYISKTAGSLKNFHARMVAVSPAGFLRDPGFRG